MKYQELHDVNHLLAVRRNRGNIIKLCIRSALYLHQNSANWALIKCCFLCIGADSHIVS